MHPRAAVLAVALGLTLGLGGSCAGFGGGSERPSGDTIDIGLKRGAAWTTLSLKRNKLIGSTATLELKRKEIFGFLNGYPVRLTVKNDELSGFAGRGSNQPRNVDSTGRVQIDIEEVEGKLFIEGTWADDRVRFEITADNFNGTIVSPLMGQCQFVLDKTNVENGERSGTSICSGMPEETRLIFPRAIENWLTRGEAVAVLLALLASSPVSSTDPSRSGW